MALERGIAEHFPDDVLAADSPPLFDPRTPRDYQPAAVAVEEVARQV